MNKMLLPCLFLFSLAVTGCVTMTPEASKIMLHPSNSTQLQNCKMIGPVTAEASAWTQASYEDVRQQAKNNLRDAAARQYGNQVDSVALVNVDTFATKAVANGIAYKCF